TRSKRDWSSDVCSSDLVDVDIGVGGVDQFDEVVLHGRAGVAATAVDLVDPEVAGGDDGGRGGGGEAGREAQAEREGRDGAADAQIGRASCRERGGGGGG